MNETQETIGCPALELQRLPGGFDCVEPMARMDYEAIISDLFHKCNEAFINAPQRRDVRPGYFKLIIGDIAEAIASVLPVDNRAARSGVRALPSDGAARSGVRALPSDGRAGAPSPADSEQQRLEAFKARKIHWQTFATKVDLADMGRTQQNGKVYEIRIQKRRDPKETTDFFCSVNGTTVLDGTFYGSAWTAKRILESAMQALVNAKARRSRMKRLADKRRAGILTPEQELAETVKRQKEEA